jgi:hypothetical protein
VQGRVQPLQHRLSNLWNFSGLGDSSQVSKNLMEKQDVDKRVRALTKLTKDHAVADLATDYFDSKHPFPEVCSFCMSIFGFCIVFLLYFFLS